MESPTCLKHAVLWFCCEKNMKSPSNQSSHRAEKTSGNARPVSCVSDSRSKNLHCVALPSNPLNNSLTHPTQQKKCVLLHTPHLPNISLCRQKKTPRALHVMLDLRCESGAGSAGIGRWTLDYPGLEWGLRP